MTAAAIEALRKSRSTRALLAERHRAQVVRHQEFRAQLSADQLDLSNARTPAKLIQVNLEQMRNWRGFLLYLASFLTYLIWHHLRTDAVFGACASPRHARAQTAAAAQAC